MIKIRRTFATYALVGICGSAALLFTSTASARGFGGFEFNGQLSNLTPDQIATEQTNRFSDEANLLGISVDEVKSAWASGKSIQELATEKGITKEQLQAKRKEAKTTQTKARLQTLVDKGVITQAQADARLQAMQAKELTRSQNRVNNKGKPKTT